MKKGAWAVLGCYVLWGILPLFWHQLQAVNAVYQLGCRVLFSMVFAALILSVQGKAGQIKAVFHDRAELKKLIAAGVLICVNWGVYIWAVQQEHVIDASLAYYMSPVLSILFATLVFREKMTKLQWAAAGLMFLGLLITIIRYRQIPWIALIIGGSFAVYGVIKKGVHVSAGVSVFFETLTVAPFALAFLIYSECTQTGAIGVLHGWQWLLIPMTGLVTTVPLMLFAKGVRETPMSLSGLLLVANPTLQLLVSVLFWQEDFTETHAILFAFAWSGVALYLIAGFLKDRKKK